MIAGSIRATRVVACEFAGRKVRSLTIPYVIGALVMVALTAWLLHFSRWWLLLALPVYAAILLGVVILVGAIVAIRIFRGRNSSAQNRQVNKFVDKIERVADGMQVGPYFILLRILRDIVWPKQTSFVAQISQDSTTLHTDFLDLQRKFD